MEYWKYKTGGAIRGVPMFYKNERVNRIEDVFTSSFDNFLYSFKIKNGGHTWLSPTLSRVYNRMHFDRAVIFLAPFGTVVLGYDPHTGLRVGDFNAGARIRSAPMTANDRLFLGLNDGNLVCLTRQPPPPPETEGTQSQTQTQTQSQSQTQTQTQTQTEEEAEAPPEPMLESQSQTQTQTQSQTQTQTRSL
jgi:outer membrane protein assembly factor BamB